MPTPVLAFLYFCPIPVLARSITNTGIKWCQYRYWYTCSFVQYQYWHGTLPVLPFTWCLYQYWHFGTFVQYQYWHGTLLALALNVDSTGIGIFAVLFNTSLGMVHYQYCHCLVPIPVLAFLVIWSIISIGMVHYWYWHLMVPIPVMAFMHLCPIPVSAWYITVTGIKWCQNQYWHICTFVQYQYWQYITSTGMKWCPCRYRHLCNLVQYQYRQGTLQVRALNGARTSIGIFALWPSTSMGTVHYQYWH